MTAYTQQSLSVDRPDVEIGPDVEQISLDALVIRASAAIDNHICSVSSGTYELVLGTSWLGYELAWYDLVRVRVDRHPVFAIGEINILLLLNCAWPHGTSATPERSATKQVSYLCLGRSLLGHRLCSNWPLYVLISTQAWRFSCPSLSCPALPAMSCPAFSAVLTCFDIKLMKIVKKDRIYL